MAHVVEQLLQAAYDAALDNRDGAPADYIPELAAVDPDHFGIAVATADGYLYTVDDTDVPFTIQSISKPFTHALALADRGLEAVSAKIDVEPSGEPFNEISLDPVSERPRNPMINAGAITATSLVAGGSTPAMFERIRELYSRCAGRTLAVDESVYRSELESGHRNRAIGQMLRSFDIIETEPDPIVDLYFRQCSIEVTAKDLALMAATLANNGVHAATGDAVIEPWIVERTLSVMATCGMYDSAGKWVANVGLPAKSGVGGGIIAVLPGQLAIAVYSPRLDEHGNSVRGIQVCQQLSRELELHFLHVARAGRSAIRAAYSVADTPSRMRRTRDERDLLDSLGDKSRIYELHGDLLFAGAETAVREISSGETTLEVVIIDVRQVDEVSPVAVSMITEIRNELSQMECGVALVDPEGKLGLSRSLLNAPGGRVFADLDSAVQWCEDILLDRHWRGPRPPRSIELRDHPLLAGLTDEQFARVAALVEAKDFRADELLVRSGEEGRGLFFILEGRVDSEITDQSGHLHRIMTLSPGMTFGEVALLTQAPSLSDMVAHTDGRLSVLPRAAYEALAREQPRLETTLMRTIATGAYEQRDIALRWLTRSGDPER